MNTIMVTHTCTFANALTETRSYNDTPTCTHAQHIQIHTHTTKYMQTYIQMKMQ